MVLRRNGLFCRKRNNDKENALVVGAVAVVAKDRNQDSSLGKTTTNLSASKRSTKTNSTMSSCHHRPEGRDTTETPRDRVPHHVLITKQPENHNNDDDDASDISLDPFLRPKPRTPTPPPTSLLCGIVGKPIRFLHATRNDDDMIWPSDEEEEEEEQEKELIVFRHRTKVTATILV